MSRTWNIRPGGDDDLEKLHAVINTAAEAYRGVIPPDCWHEPYMPREHLADQIAAGVTLWGYEQAGGLIGVMGTQAVRDVHLVRHAYVAPDRTDQLLKSYWDIPRRQIETSVVLVKDSP